MSELLHSGQHPGADQLSAFAEHVLPDHERLETLAHLAECSDCRQIVFLAEWARASQGAISHTLPGRMDWLRNWRYLWPVAAAATCGLLIFPLLHRRRPVDAPRRPAIALESGSPIPPSTAQLPQPIVPVVPLSGKISPKTKIDSSSRPDSPIIHASAGIGSVNGSVPTPSAANSPSVFELNSATVDQQSTASLSANARAVGGGLAGPVPQGGPSLAQKNNLLAARQTQTSALQSQNQLFPQQVDVPRGSNDSVHGEIQQSANQTVSVASAAPPVVQTESAVLSTSSFSGATAQAKIARAPLPSNQPVASIITNGVETVAVDSLGELFVSKDAGVRWQRVGHQWTGKAIKVVLASAAMTQPAPSAPQSAGTRSSTGAETVTPATVARRVGFDLVTDSGALWSSPDGFVWKQR
jgi:hypothetical protein